MGIRINIIVLVGLMCTCTAFAKSPLAQKVDHVISLGADAQDELLRLTREATENEDFHALVRANFALGWYQYKEKNLGKAIIYYLEGLRYSEETTYDGVVSDRISMYQTSGRIYDIFNDFDNAQKSYESALAVAKDNQRFDRYCDVLYNSANLLHHHGFHEDALNLFETVFDYYHELEESLIADVYNARGDIYTAIGNYDQALSEYNKVQAFVNGKEGLETWYTQLAMHNIGNVYLQKKDYTQAVANYKETLKYQQNFHPENLAIFVTLMDLGECYIALGSMGEAATYLSAAEMRLDSINDKQLTSALYKMLGSLNLRQGNVQAYSAYQDLYGETLEAFLADKQAIESKDKKYNLELITSRYYAMVKEQKETRKVRDYAKIGGFSLVGIILLILGFHRYTRYRLRRDLEVSLRPFSETVYVD